ncbi:MAG: glycosyltransferase family 4 protein [Leptolyngbya sp. SIO1D8]|nr:glycosyltransferase family 4 protein [Leptolyngbya sp. SIO1D8]
MHIAYFTGLYPRATDTFIQREVIGLRKLGINVHTFSVRRPGDEHIVGAEQTSERSQTKYLLPINLRHFLTSHLTLLITSPNRYLRSIRLALSTSQPGLKGLLYQVFYFLEAGILAQEISETKISHIHNHIANSSCTVAMLAAELGGFSFSFTMHGPHIFFEPMRWRLDEKIKRAKFVACISHFCRSQGMMFAAPEHWPKMQIVRCGVELSLFESITHQGIGNCLLYVGRLASEKGLPILLKSLRQLLPQYPDLKLTVVGDGADRTYLEELTTKMQLDRHVNFVGYQSQTSVREYLKATDIFVLPSFAEGIPVVLMEAMATGVPVIATQIAGISELVQSGLNGYLVSPGDSDALAQTLSELIPDAEKRNCLGRNGRQKIETDFNITDALNELAKWLALPDRINPIPQESGEKHTKIPDKTDLEIDRTLV